MPAPLPVTALVAAALAALVAGCSADPGGGGGTSTGRVVRVVDGDTIHVSAGGRREKVRYIGVDTPEAGPGAAPECFGRDAAAANASLVSGERVRLVRDAEARDRYGRLLAYVYRERDGRFVNAELVRRGFAAPLTVEPNVRHARRLARLASEARVADRGMWSACRSP